MRGAGEHERKATLVSLAPARTCSLTGSASAEVDLETQTPFYSLHQHGSANDHRQPASRPAVLTTSGRSGGLGTGEADRRIRIRP